MATHSQPIPEFVSHLSKTFNPKKQRSGECFGGYTRASEQHLTFMFMSPVVPSFYPCHWTPLTSTWTPTPCDAPFPQEGEPGGSLLNPDFQSDVMETWAEKQHWKADGCTLGNFPTCAGRLWRPSLASHMLLRERGWDEGFSLLMINDFLSACHKGYLGFQSVF